MKLKKKAIKFFFGLSELIESIKAVDVQPAGIRSQTVTTLTQKPDKEM